MNAEQSLAEMYGSRLLRAISFVSCEQVFAVIYGATSDRTISWSDRTDTGTLLVDISL